MKPLPHHLATAAASVEGQRLAVLDVLRGVAVLGILLMNIQSFGRFSSEYLNPKALGEPPPLDWAVWIVSHVVADEKFITMLTVLFGAGIVLMARNAKGSAEDFERRFRRRMAWLFVFGLVHGLFVWPGDILAAYAVCGVIAVQFRHRPADTLVRLGLLLYAGGTVLWLAFSAGLIFLLPTEWLQFLISQYWTPTAEIVYAELNRLTFGWLASTGERAVNALGAQAWMFASDRGWRMLAMMFLGMALMQVGFISGQWPLRGYCRVAVFGLALGIPVVLAGFLFNELVVDWDFRYSMFLGRIANHWASIAIALAWIAIVILLVRHSVLGQAMHALEAVGRLAMTNYLGQSILCAGIFYGVGLGLFSRLGYAQLLGVVVLVWAVQVGFSLLWRRFHGVGPFEMLWRRLASG
ncbi:DUF418 domain-containing protein [Aquisalimonas sp.]|uniref:DUF418 domain-containing protein n=1 Tax=Aquisalimonas sp. TaxID=1872621 RepID=UPI0025B7D467|nr:DUF418 domain-containing protein [Aquisalimonas sp.]